MIHFSIPIVAPSLNLWYSGQHWSKRKKIADTFHQFIKVICKQEKIQPITQYPVKITTRSFYKKKRKFDCSNVFTANKLCEDGLVRAGILIDDTPQYVSGHEVLCPRFGADEDMTIVIIENGR